MIRDGHIAAFPIADGPPLLLRKHQRPVDAAFVIGHDVRVEARPRLRGEEFTGRLRAGDSRVVAAQDLPRVLLSFALSLASAQLAAETKAALEATGRTLPGAIYVTWDGCGTVG